MQSLTIAWEYLTGYVVATDPSSRDRAEWPPHPARVFMALAAALFETELPASNDDGHDDWVAEKAALAWLETLGDPEMHLPDFEHDAERSNVTVYVPVNDRVNDPADPSRMTLQSCPAITRDRKPRTFPRRWVGNGPCFLRWPNAEGAELHSIALARLCRKVTRLGHSSSLVAMRVCDAAETLPANGAHLVTESLQPELQARSLARGTLDMLRDRFGAEAREHHAALSGQIGDLRAKRKAASGKGAKELKAQIDVQIQSLEAELSNTTSRPPIRPTTGLWTGYRRADRGRCSPELAHSLFDPNILILSQVSGPALPVVSTISLIRVLRDAVMSQSDVQPAPDWVCGHLPDGQPLRDGKGHLACIPLPDVGHGHADGHLLGVGLVFPRWVTPRDRARVLGKLLVEPSGEWRTVLLTLGRLGEWKGRKSDWSEPRRSLQPERWTAFPRGAQTWASVTPVVLDRFPKASRGNPDERAQWENEVQQIVRDACTHIGLPVPELIDIDTTSWHIGSPRAVSKRRPLRGLAPPENRRDAVLGDGYPEYPAKGTNASRPQLHVWLQFAQPVIGPVLLGAGRHLGYGLCKPWEGRR